MHTYQGEGHLLMEQEIKVEAYLQALLVQSTHYHLTLEDIHVIL